jgi:hypothetical protein
MAGKKPEYNLCVRKKDSDDRYTQVGAAWLDDSGRGSINIKLNPCVILSNADNMNFVLFLNKDNTRRVHREPTRQHSEPDYGPPPVDDDDVPF